MSAYTSVVRPVCSGPAMTIRPVGAADIARALGGFEIAFLVGVMLGAAARSLAVVLDDLPGFHAAEHRYWLVDIPSDREHYLSLISTYSTTLRLPDENRQGLFACIGSLMDREFGGRITKRYRFDLVVRQRLRDG